MTDKFSKIVQGVEKMPIAENVRTIPEQENPFYVSPEMQQVIADCRDENFDAMQDKLVGLLREHHDQEFIQFLTDKGNGMQISLRNWAKHLLTRTADREPWLIPLGSRPASSMDGEKFVRVAQDKYVLRNLEAEKVGHVDYGIGDVPGQSGPDGKEFPCEAELYINGARYDQQVFDAETDQDEELVWQRVRQGVIDDLIREWGAPKIEALDSHGRSVMLTAEEVADTAMKQHYLEGRKRLFQPFSRRPQGQDIETIYGSRASDMRGSVRVNDVSMTCNKGVVTLDEISEAGKTYTIKYQTPGGPDAKGLGLSRVWRPDNVLRRGSKTVYKPVRKVSLREKARAQRRARRKSR